MSPAVRAIATALDLIGGADRLQYLFDGLTQDATGFLQRHLFLGPQVDFDYAQDALAPHNGRDRDRHITQSLGTGLQRADWQNTSLIQGDGMDDISD